MTTLIDMHQKLVSSFEHNKMIRSVTPLFDYYGMNHFYYVHTFPNGKCAILGTHAELHEYKFENIDKIYGCPNLRHPDSCIDNAQSLKNTSDHVYKDFLDQIWNKFGVDYPINIQKKTNNGLISFGFGVNYRNPSAESFFINELPILNRFINHFFTENKKLIDLAHEYQVDMPSIMGSRFYETPHHFPKLGNKNALTRQLGLKGLELLTDREIEILSYLANGYPANYIAKKLHLSPRTVENYLANMKLKLDCESKLALIKIACEILPLLRKTC